MVVLFGNGNEAGRMIQDTGVGHFSDKDRRAVGEM